jgi:putative hydrolase of the HAD superfamily
LIDEVSTNARVALLSNTNEIHWRQIESQFRLSAQFEGLFLSHETGQYKPDPDAFRTVMSTMNCAPSQILFFDDSEKNVVAARELGIDARLVSGIQGVQKELSKLI